MPAWEDLKHKPKAESSGPTELQEACAQALTTPSGRRLMDVLRKLYIEAVLPGMPDERALAHLNTKRQFVRELETATAAGLAALAKGKTAT